MFEERSTAIEHLDRFDCEADLAAASYRFMEIVNRYFGGIQPVRRFVAAAAADGRAGDPLRILDIGTGSCDIPLAVSRWARARGVPLQFTCLETGRHAAAIARRKLARARDPAVQLLHEDIFSHQPAQPYDYAVASMCCHHFSDARIISLLRKLRGFVHRGVLINDLLRSRGALLAARLLSAASPAGVRHDALLSIRRGFKVGELAALLHQIEGAAVRVTTARWFRVVALVDFLEKETA